MRPSCRNQAGFSLIEVLFVTSVLTLIAMIAIPLVTERTRQARVRAIANQLAIDLRAARLVAVSNRSAVDVVITTGAYSAYHYTDARGKLREVRLPDGVRIVNSTSPIAFRPNGSVLGGASTTLEADLSPYAKERWTIKTTVLGFTRTSHALVKM